MRDQAALAVDHVGIAGAAHLDGRDDVPDQLQVHLREGHAGIAARMGDGDREVRLGFLAEVDRAEPDPVRLCLPEARFRGMIGSAPEDVHREA